MTQTPPPPHPDSDVEQPSCPPRRWSRTHKIAACAVAATVAAAIITAYASASPSQAGTGDEGVIQQCITNGAESDCSIDNSSGNDLTDDQIEDQVLQGAPSTGIPIPTVVLYTEELGLKIRTTPDMNGQQVGSAANHGTVWVECQLDSGFNPAPDTKGGSVWFRVHWPSSELGTTFFNSEPGNPAEAWAYSGYLYTFGGSGTVIPQC